MTSEMKTRLENAYRKYLRQNCAYLIKQKVITMSEYLDWENRTVKDQEMIERFDCAGLLCAWEGAKLTRIAAEIFG